MCRAALGGDANTAQAEAVNDGIVYLMAFPYLLLLVGGIVIYRIMKGKKKNKIVLKDNIEILFLEVTNLNF